MFSCGETNCNRAHSYCSRIFFCRTKEPVASVVGLGHMLIDKYVLDYVVNTEI